MPLRPKRGYDETMSRPRLSPEKWLIAGLDALAVSGPNALAAEPLARALGTTKGSFYWHFKDVPTFQQAVLTAWETAALEHVVTQLSRTDDADKRLRDFGQTVLTDPVESQLRIWGQTDERVAIALVEVDTERLNYLTRLLRQLGLGNPDFARAVLATLIGLPLTGADTDAAPFDTLVDTVLALS